VRQPIPDPPPAANGRFELRRMRAGDIPRVVDIEKDGFAHPWSAELLGRELHHDWSTSLVATEEGPGGAELILGFIVFWLVHDEVHVLNVAVAADARRRGVARFLMDEAALRGRRAGARLATLEVRRSNEAAITLYRSLGYRQVGVRPNYYVDEGEDAIVMILDL
jgi:[ribosomal protein S18]-alanine N-acetyltransferase